MDALEHILRLAYTYILSSSAAVSIALTVPFPPRPKRHEVCTSGVLQLQGKLLNKLD